MAAAAGAHAATFAQPARIWQAALSCPPARTDREGRTLGDEGRAAPPAVRRRGVPDRLLLPPAPRDPDLAARWVDLPFEERRRLGHASLQGTAGYTDADARLVVGLARTRVATGWRLQVAALVWGWLVLMTVWGFGRSSFPDHETAWLAGGLVAGGLVWVAAGVAALRRVRRARAVATGGDDAGPDGD